MYHHGIEPSWYHENSSSHHQSLLYRTIPLSLHPQTKPPLRLLFAASIFYHAPEFLRLLGLDFYQHLCSPIQDIVPRPGEPPVPLRCEVIVTPSFFPSSGSTSSRSSVSHFLRGWAQARVSRETGRVSLRQQVAPRKSARLSARNGADSLSDQDPAPLPPAMLHALGNVARGGGGLEKLVTQEVTYMGGRLRIGRTKDGDVFVYERCMWPRDRL